MSEDGGVLRPQRGPLDVHRAHADSEGSVPDGCSHGRGNNFLYLYLKNTLTGPSVEKNMFSLRMFNTKSSKKRIKWSAKSKL